MELTGWRLLVGIVAFLGELALAAGVGVAAYRLVGGGVLAWLAATLAGVGLIALWARYMSPRAPRRLARPARAGLAALLCAGVAGALGLSEPGSGWAVAFGGLALVLAGAQLALPDVLADPAAPGGAPPTRPPGRIP